MTDVGRALGEMNLVGAGSRHDKRRFARAIRRAVAATLTAALPKDLADEVAIELGFSLRRALYSRATRLRLARLDGCRVNVGCGDRPAPGWVNIELNSSAQTYFWDCRRGLPFSDDRVTAIYCEHVFEHFRPEGESSVFLRECRRCLRRGGVLRIVVPDAGAYLRAYGQNSAQLAALSLLKQTEEGWREMRLNYRGQHTTYRTQIQLTNEVFRQGYQHKYAYDEETLVLALHHAGFSKVMRQRFGVSLDPDMTADNELREAESLYVEATK
ncbi:MAG: methyltransferase domain-containing protein [Alphaproteobacteria bacterium]|nr:methyltransferase domain-containing protein [Alphaproteobacteria bacterium]